MEHLCKKCEHYIQINLQHNKCAFLKEIEIVLYIKINCASFLWLEKGICFVEQCYRRKEYSIAWRLVIYTCPQTYLNIRELRPIVINIYICIVALSFFGLVHAWTSSAYAWIQSCAFPVLVYSHGRRYKTT